MDVIYEYGVLLIEIGVNQSIRSKVAEPFKILLKLAKIFGEDKYCGMALVNLGIIDSELGLNSEAKQKFDKAAETEQAFEGRLDQLRKKLTLVESRLEQQRKGTAPREHSLSSISNLLRKIAKMGSRPVSNFLEEPSFGNLGIISLTERKLKEIVERLVKMGKVSRGEKDSVLEVLLAKVEESKRELENFIREILSHMNIPTRLEFENLKREIEQLKKQIVKENG